MQKASIHKDLTRQNPQADKQAEWEFATKTEKLVAGDVIWSDTAKRQIKLGR